MDCHPACLYNQRTELFVTSVYLLAADLLLTGFMTCGNQPEHGDKLALVWEAHEVVVELCQHSHGGYQPETRHRTQQGEVLPVLVDCAQAAYLTGYCQYVLPDVLHLVTQQHERTLFFRKQYDFLTQPFHEVLGPVRAALEETLRICHSLRIEQMLRPVLLAREVFYEPLAQTQQVRVVHVVLVLDVDTCQFVTLQRPGNLLSVHGIRLQSLLLACSRNVCRMDNDVFEAELRQGVVVRESSEASLIGRLEVRPGEFLVQSVKELLCISMLSE